MSAQTSEPAPNGLAAVKKTVGITGPVRDLDEMWRLANALSQSRLIPDALRDKPADVLVTVLYGQELGLAPMQAMQVIHVIKGKPFISANLWVALARKAGHKVRVIESTAETCTVEVRRDDDPDFPMPATYTMGDAQTAGLTTNDNYRKNPKAMLYARAASTAIRQAAPEVALGFGDEAEAMVIAGEREDRPTLAQVAAKRDGDDTPEPVDAEVLEPEKQREEVLALAAAHEQPAEDPWDGIEVAQPGGGPSE